MKRLFAVLMLVLPLVLSGVVLLAGAAQAATAIEY